MVLRAYVLLSWCLLLPFGALPAQADPITVIFTAFPAADDPVNTEPATGSFTFDSSLIPAGGGLIRSETGFGATDLNFFWGNTLWTTANADIGELKFSPSGGLLLWLIGGKVNHLHGLSTGEVVDDFFAFASAGGGELGNAIRYTNAGQQDILTGRVVSDFPEPVPEPSTIVLVATGTALIGRAARRRRTNAS